MQYIIERDIDRDRWCVMLPVWHTTDHGVRYLVYEHDAAPSLHDAVVYAYHHRAAYSNWDCVILINGREVLYCEDVTDGIVIRYIAGKSITLTKENI
jgi:hypothetical protein